MEVDTFPTPDTVIVLDLTEFEICIDGGMALPGQAVAAPKTVPLGQNV
jgi:hypothetical protein